MVTKRQPQLDSRVASRVLKSSGTSLSTTGGLSRRSSVIASELQGAESSSNLEGQTGTRTPDLVLLTGIEGVGVRWMSSSVADAESLDGTARLVLTGGRRHGR